MTQQIIMGEGSLYRLQDELQDKLPYMCMPTKLWPCIGDLSMACLNFWPGIDTLKKVDFCFYHIRDTLKWKVSLCNYPFTRAQWQ